MSEQTLRVTGLKKYFATRRGTVRAVDGVSLSINRGETLALIGESGSGKTTVANTIIGKYVPTEGQILLEGRSIAQLIYKRPKALRQRVQMVFQDPGSSLNPRRTVKQTLGLPLKLYHHESREERRQRMLELLERVELSSEYLTKVSSALSGGEKARIGVARALATEPTLVILDEPTSALDVSIQAKIINMLLRLQRELTLSYLFITHDLSLMRNVATFLEKKKQ
jgi:ABC-type oligopeptide transport system ATPase subunit